MVDRLKPGAILRARIETRDNKTGIPVDEEFFYKVVEVGSRKVTVIEGPIFEGSDKTRSNHLPISEIRSGLVGNVLRVACLTGRELWEMRFVWELASRLGLPVPEALRIHQSTKPVLREKLAMEYADEPVNVKPKGRRRFLR